MSVTGVRDRPPGLRSPAAFHLPMVGQASLPSATPGVVSTITVTGTFLSILGAPASGTVTFTPTSAPLKNVPGAVFSGAPVTATLNGSGSFSVVVACTDDTDWTPSGWTYTITTSINGIVSSYPGKLIPYSPGSAIDLSDLLP